MTEEDREALRNGAMIRYKNGLDIKRTDPAVLQELMDRVKAKQDEAPQILNPT